MWFSPLYGGWHGWVTYSKSDMKTTWMKETTVERKDCSEKKPAKQNCLGSPKVFTPVFAKINSLVSSRILNMWKGSFLSHTRIKPK